VLIAECRDLLAAIEIDASELWSVRQ
jgi:hypothetical protein